MSEISLLIESLSMITGNDHDGIFKKVFFFERSKDFTKEKIIIQMPKVIATCGVSTLFPTAVSVLFPTFFVLNLKSHPANLSIAA